MWAGNLELCGVLNLVKIDSSLVGEVVEDVACLLSLFAPLLEPAHHTTPWLPLECLEHWYQQLPQLSQDLLHRALKDCVQVTAVQPWLDWTWDSLA